MLHDAGFVAMIIAPTSRIALSRLERSVSNVGLVLARWLVFTVMFESGAGKLLGGHSGP